ncbi:mitochondrial ribonuclease P catalytic subunit-like [Corticium candelabrum]|uniref:mitochondrial ribonuclease P catalytic subunit-like n=1 Tax=Corticium candelabrum TaxID=121492 RepID=UPI002E26FECE|nr:mitochondrial ribonuclease P catalytic subunit-like [Corticium candelabrum]
MSGGMRQSWLTSLRLLRGFESSFLFSSFRVLVRCQCAGASKRRRRVYYDFVAGQCVKHGDVNRASELASTMEQEQDFVFQKGAFRSLLYLYAHHSRPDDMLRIKQIMIDKKQLLDSSAYSSLVSGLVAAGRLEDAFKQLREAEATSIDLQARMFVPIIEKLVELRRVEEGRELWREMVDDHRLWPTDAGLGGIFRGLSETKSDDWVWSIFQEMRNEYRCIDLVTTQAIAHWFNSCQTDKWRVTTTSISGDGHCCACGHKLESIELPPDRKAALLRRTTELLSGFENTDGVANAETCRDAARDTHRRALTHRIREIETQIVQLEANTLHNSSDKHIRDMLEDRKSQLKLLRRNMPLTLKGLYERLGLQPPLLSEVKHFKDWIARTGPYNVVVDGLNVAGFNSRGKTDLLKVEGVVRHFLDQGKRVLLIFRKHVYDNRRYRPILKRLTEVNTCHVYYTSNRRVDDWFFLYAAVCGDMEIELVTNDQMRDHRQLFHGKLYQDFLKWQQRHQVKLLHFRNNLRPTFQSPQAHDSVVQWTGDTYHFPMTEMNQWLCVTKIQRNNLANHR